MSTKATNLNLRSKKLLFSVLSLYLLLAIGYGVVTPLFETPDEHHHYYMVRHLATTGQLPIIGVDAGLARQEAAQPPLYYIVGALLITPIDLESDPFTLWPNPFVQLGDASSPGNNNAFIHTEAEAWPWRGDILAAHLLRLLSTLFGIGTLVGIYGCAQQLWPNQEKTAVSTTALIAFLPQFLFIHAAITNDTAVTGFSSLALWQLLRLWRVPPSNKRLITLGITIGLTILSKMAGLALLALAALVLGWLAWQNGRLFTLPRQLTLLVTPALLLASWLLWRNWILYGDPTAANQFVMLAGGDRQYTLLQAWGEMGRVWRSFFGFFGWMTVPLPLWAYRLWQLVVMVALVGVLWGGHRWRWYKPANQMAFTLIVWAALIFVAWGRFLLQTSADQGRLLFPALATVAILLTYGLNQYRQRWLHLFVPISFLTTAIYSLIILIPRAYAPPTILLPTELPDTALSLTTPMGAGIQLTATQPPDNNLSPGDGVPLTTYWQATHPITEAKTAVYELWGRDQTIIGKLHTYHGQGRYPTNVWPLNKIIVDEATVRINNDTAVPTQATVRVKLLGEESVAIGHIKVTPNEWPPFTAAIAHIGEHIQLAEATVSERVVSAGTTLSITLRWQITGDPHPHLTTFVHLGDPTQAPLAQADGPPLNGDYPTHLWAAGENFNDTYHLQLPPHLPAGQYPLQIGLYNSQTGQRLPLMSAGKRQPHDAYHVVTLTVE